MKCKSNIQNFYASIGICLKYQMFGNCQLTKIITENLTGNLIFGTTVSWWLCSAFIILVACIQFYYLVLSHASWWVMTVTNLHMHLDKKSLSTLRVAAYAVYGCKWFFYSTDCQLARIAMTCIVTERLYLNSVLFNGINLLHIVKQCEVFCPQFLYEI